MRIRLFTVFIFLSPALVAAQTYDQYGGLNSGTCSGGAQAHFYTEKASSGRWHFCTPDGHWFFSNSIYAMQVISTSKYGGNLDTARSSAVLRAQAWNFNAIGIYWTTEMPPIGWGATGTGNPTKAPFMHIFRMADRASRNRDGVGTQPIKELNNGSCTSPPAPHVSCNHALSPFGVYWDFYDPAFTTYATNMAKTTDTTQGTYTADFPNSWATGKQWVIGFVPDDSDNLTGLSGPGPEFPGRDGTTHPHPGHVIATAPPVQTNNGFLAGLGCTPANSCSPYADNTVFSKNAWRDFLINKYTTIAALNAAWGASCTGICFDNAINNRSAENVSSVTYAYQVKSNFEGALFLGVTYRSSTCSVSTGTPPTYAAAALTFVRKDVSSFDGLTTSEAWYLKAPASGTNNVVITMTCAVGAGNWINSGVISLTGVNQTTPIDAHNGTGSTDSSGIASTTVTTVADNAWVAEVSVWRTSGQTITSDETQRWWTGGGAFEPMSQGASFGPKTPAGAKTMTERSTVSTAWAISAVAFKPSTSTYGGYTTFNVGLGYPAATTGSLGLLDEDGSHNWIGSDLIAQTGANAVVKTDLDAFLKLYAAKYYSTVATAIRAHNPGILVFSNAPMNSHAGMTRRPVLQAAGASLDVIEVQHDPTRLDIAKQTFLETGRPMVTWTGMAAPTDAALNGSPSAYLVYASQAARGTGYTNEMNSKLALQALDGSFPYVGTNFWAWLDGAENVNWGLVTGLDNVYDALEPAAGSVACSPPTLSPGTCGNQPVPPSPAVRPFGDFKTAVAAANLLWMNLSTPAGSGMKFTTTGKITITGKVAIP